MANMAQQRKRVRQDAKIRSANRVFKSGLKTSMKRVEVLIEQGKKEEAQVAFNTANKKLDKALVKGIYHKNKVARQKSRLQTKINAL